ncbi:MFS transporter [Peribacillus cavernae]|uniref:MFS transporter n=1 Tax=Peribacillus cavernae TaxID=1674310 RepID=A0A433HRU8_9BACI|nr:MFS transporter [Peribacillus cavernae]MDQ0218740.1 sugar phosphate permease [Peribacillus cavernae]RUQ30953.1 MFS transporter [Peribacillus cavernae]
MNNGLLKEKTMNLAEPWHMLYWLMFAQLMVAFVGRSIGPLGALIGSDLSLSKAQIGLLPAAMFLGQATASIPVGFVADRIGSRILLLYLSFCLGISFMLLTFLSLFGAMLFLIFIGGLGYGGMHPVSNRGIIYWFSQKQRGTAMGLKQMGVTGGSALAALLLLPLSVSIGWRTALFIACLVLLASGVFSYMYYRDSPEGIVNSTARKKSFPFYRSLVNMLQNKPLFLVSISAMGLSGSQVCLNTYIVLFAHEKLGFSLFLSGLLFAISEVSGSIGRIAWGAISDRFFNGQRIGILMIITLISVTSSVIIAELPSGTLYWVMVPLIAVFGFALSGFNGIWMNLASELVPRELSGISSGFSITLGSLGNVFIPPLFGLMVDVNGSFTFGWLMLAGVLAIVLVILSLLSHLLKRTASKL